MQKLHLCHPDQQKSCGACCGLYNYRVNSRGVLAERLRRRSERFIALRNEPRRYGKAVTLLEGEKLYETIYNCEFLGFIDEGEQKVGCLLHPQLNNGVDLRGISFYGHDLCRNHLCPSYEKLTKGEKETVIRIVNDWYLYGLCITDVDLIKSYLAPIQNAVGEAFNPKKLLKKPELMKVMGEFFLWKETWPFRRQEALRFGKYYFLAEEYHIARIDYEGLGIDPSPYDGIFLSFATEFKERKEVASAERMVRGNIERVVELYLRE